MNNRVKRLKKLIVLIVIVLIGLFLFFINLYSKEIDEWTCAYTGSKMTSTKWFSLITTKQNIENSPIEEWLEINNRIVEHKWIKTSFLKYSNLGTRLRGHSPAPPVYYFAYSYQKWYLDDAKTDEVDSFLLKLKTGTIEEQRLIIKAIIEKLRTAE